MLHEPEISLKQDNFCLLESVGIINIFKTSLNNVKNNWTISPGRLPWLHFCIYAQIPIRFVYCHKEKDWRLNEIPGPFPHSTSLCKSIARIAKATAFCRHLLLERRKCWGWPFCHELDIGWVHIGQKIFSILAISDGLFWRKSVFLCFYIIKSIARKGYFGPKYP